MDDRGKCGSVTTGSADLAGRNRGGVVRFGMALEKFGAIPKRNEKSDQGSGARRDPLGVSKITNSLVWGIIWIGFSCVGCSSFVVHF